jgi:hypothetical protein
MQDYQVFGLHVRSELVLPELFPAHEARDPDVTISTGPVSAPDEDAGLYEQNGALVFVVPGVARYRIERGCKITVESAPEVPERNVRLYLLGSVFGATLHQRGLLPLHANAVEIDKGAVALMGPSGAGKSTLAAWFQDQGLPVLADDVCVVGFGDEGPFTSAGVRRLRLSRAAVEARGFDPSAFPESYLGDPGYEKVDVPVGSDISGGAILPLAALYVLDEADELSITRIAGVDAAEQVFAHTYRGAFVRLAGAERVHWSACVRLVSAVPLFRFARNWSLAKMDAQNLVLLEHARAMVAEASSSR